MTHHPRTNRTRPARLGFLAILMIPLLLVLNAPVLAAVVPTALLAVATLQAEPAQHALPATQVVDTHDVFELQRVEAALPIAAKTRRVS